MSAGMFIDKPGLYRFAHKRDCYELKLSFRGTELRWESSYSELAPGGSSMGGGSAGSGMRLKATTDPWFVFVESPGNYWICDGSDQLEYDLNERSKGTGGPAISRGEVLDGSPRPPAEVIARLPANLQKLYPPEQSPPRPSI